MKRLFLIIATLALVGCSDNTENTENVTPVQSMSIQSDMPSLESASDFGNMKIEQSPYDFSSIEKLRESILIQAEKESLTVEVVSAGIDELAGKLITENFEKLSQATTEEEAESAMMALFMRAMGAKKLKTILNLK